MDKTIQAKLLLELYCNTGGTGVNDVLKKDHFFSKQAMAFIKMASFRCCSAVK